MKLRLTLLGISSLIMISGCAKTDETNRATSSQSPALATPSVPSTTTPQPPPQAAKNGWWVRVCTSHTQASGIRLEIGLGGNSGSHRYWRDWRSNDPPEFDVPDDFRTVQEIWIKGVAAPGGRNVHMCTYYRGDSTQKMTFDADEEHETSQGDRDDCGC